MNEGRPGGHPVAVPLLLVGLAAAAYLGWLLRVEIIVLFASLLFGLSLYQLARWLSDKTGISHQAAVGSWYVGGILFGVLVLMFSAERITDDYGELSERIPAALEKIQTSVEGTPVLGTLGSQVGDLRSAIMEDGQERSSETEAEQQEAVDGQMRFVSISLSVVAYFFVWAALSFYIASQGQQYLKGALALIPPDRREVGEELFRCLASALPWWLAGRFASMAAVTLLTAPGLMLLGIPLPFTLALIAGWFSFVPMLGPVASTIPAILVTLDAAPQKLFWVLVLYGGIQFLESYLITPQIQKRVASVPPLLLISAQVVMGVLVGIPGVMFSTPIVLTLMVALQIVYIRHTLEEQAAPPKDPVCADEEAAA